MPDEKPTIEQCRQVFLDAWLDNTDSYGKTLSHGESVAIAAVRALCLQRRAPTAVLPASVEWDIGLACLALVQTGKEDTADRLMRWAESQPSDAPAKWRVEGAQSSIERTGTGRAVGARGSNVAEPSKQPDSSCPTGVREDVCEVDEGSAASRHAAPVPASTKPCSHCGRATARTSEIQGWWRVECACGIETTRCSSEADALAVWDNRRAPAPSPASGEATKEAL